MAKYKVGDRVVVRNDLGLHARYHMEGGTSNIPVDSMVSLRGCVVTITQYDGQYRVAEDPWRWTDGMFEGLESELVNDLPDLPDIKALFD